MCLKGKKKKYLIIYKVGEVGQGKAKPTLNDWT